LRETGLLAAVLPELARLAEQSEDEWNLALSSVAGLGSTESADFPLILAVLMHGVGAAGAALVDELGRALKLSNPERERAAWLVAQQHALDEAADLPRHRLRRILASPGASDLMRLVRAVQTAAVGVSVDAAFCDSYLTTLPDGAIDPPPLVDGRDVLSRGVRPGPRVAGLLDRVRDAQLDGAIGSRGEALAWLESLIAGGE
jgi:hypothetical protein